MDNPGDLMHLCRLCLVKDQVNIPIFEEHGDIRQIFVKISSCLPVKVSKDDQLPKRICDGCSNKLDLLYEFCNTSANSEKKLLSWLEQAGLKDVDTISAVAQHTAKPLETQTQVKQEALEDIHAAVQQTDHLELTDEGVGAAVFEENAIDESDEPPPPKRARRTAAVKAQINITPDSDDDDDMDISEPMTKVEDESDDSDVDKDPSYVDVPGTSADDQPGPSGVGKDGVEAPLENKKYYTRRKSKKIGEDADTYSESSSNSTIKLESDYIEVKIKSITFWCQNCNAKFTSEDDLQRHIEQKSCDPEPEVNENVCSICEKVFKEVKYLRIHMKNFHEDPKPRYVCCNRVYSIKEKYEKHRKKFHNDQLDRQPDGSYLCKYCNKTFQAFQSINGHINTYHTKETSYLCNVCGKKYYSLTVLHHHARTHTQAEEMKIKVVFACPSCSREFPTSDSLEAHKTTSHTQHYDKLEDSRFKCKYCDRIFIARISVENHVSSSHLQNKIFLCDNCGRHFYTQSSLKKHEVSHITERNFPCPHCLKKFRIKAELSKHIKVVHMTGTSKSTCSFCLKTFKNESSLKNHINTKHRNEENGVKSTSNSNPTDDIESNIEELFRDSTLKMDDIENNGQNQVFDLTSEIFDEQDAPVEEASESEEIMIYEIYNC